MQQTKINKLPSIKQIGVQKKIINYKIPDITTEI